MCLYYLIVWLLLSLLLLLLLFFFMWVFHTVINWVFSLIVIVSFFQLYRNIPTRSQVNGPNSIDWSLVFQFPMSLVQKIVDSSKWSNYGWYYCHLNVLRLLFSCEHKLFIKFFDFTNLNPWSAEQQTQWINTLFSSCWLQVFLLGVDNFFFI